MLCSVLRMHCLPQLLSWDWVGRCMFFGASINQHQLSPTLAQWHSVSSTGAGHPWPPLLQSWNSGFQAAKVDEAAEEAVVQRRCLEFKVPCDLSAKQSATRRNGLNCNFPVGFACLCRNGPLKPLHFGWTEKNTKSKFCWHSISGCKLQLSSALRLRMKEFLENFVDAAQLHHPQHAHQA